MELKTVLQTINIIQQKPFRINRTSKFVEKNISSYGLTEALP
jgi:hypothetical protein